jgi:REP element-mobilizing transposase RayT
VGEPSLTQRDQAGAIDRNRPPHVNQNATPARPIRKHLDHSVHFHGRFGTTYFITICCEAREQNQLCKDDIARVLFDTARRYHDSHRWYLKLLLLMPDHLHLLIGAPAETNLSNLIRDFKRVTTRSVRSTGSEISSITGYDTMRVWMRRRHTFDKTRCAPG